MPMSGLVELQHSHHTVENVRDKREDGQTILVQRCDLDLRVAQVSPSVLVAR
jgi:hypothetical protein